MTLKTEILASGNSRTNAAILFSSINIGSTILAVIVGNISTVPTAAFLLGFLLVFW